ncbi:acrylate utilization transcriptional regulator AcuR [Marinobacterium marinum]|uniref:TetR family transcriptional regulator C-terminal domain-containing protein n=1 Tax=Marinobacterium marinum TaxID=2756129 RepID=A0A7W1X0R9_9GAMM|nr:TetR/AcrR family transcriptional regulator [Marinobacterium marinum]MBA4503739.1 TetR family transcriptional regulator C-terminal domain-containing protein [Marinobacterium marinum]
MSIRSAAKPVRRRGRPPKDSGRSYTETRQALIQAGLALLTEKGYSSVGIDPILRSVDVPKGSFYHYFKSKEAFGQALIEAYADYFAGKLDRFLLNTQEAPLQRLRHFIDDAGQGIQRHAFQRGCLIGNLGQEAGVLPPSFRQQLSQVFNDWQARTARCLREAQAAGEIASDLDSDRLAAWFWIGWEGAVLRARLEASTLPLEIFAEGFFMRLQSPSPAPECVPESGPAASVKPAR